MQAVASQSRSWCSISINHEAVVQAMPVQAASRFRHTYEGQQNVVDQGLRTLLGLLRPP
jgi:hypothetical protein